VSAARISRSALASEFELVERTAFRCERQPAYLVVEESDSIERYTTGIDHDPRDDPYFAREFGRLAKLTATGRRLERVRIHDHPPTTYQRWLRWLERWHTDAGEAVHYLTRPEAVATGFLPPDGPAHDFWLFDDRVVVTLRFSPGGELLELWRDDTSPGVDEAVEWKRRVLRYLRDRPSP
jgi:hypothetical protein